MMPANRVVALRGAVGVFQLVEIARAFAVVKNDLLIKLCQVVKHVALRAKTPNPRSQFPKKLQTRSSRMPAAKCAPWSLVGASLELGVWILELRPSFLLLQPRTRFQPLPNPLVELLAHRLALHPVDDLAGKGVDQHLSGRLQSDPATAQVINR